MSNKGTALVLATAIYAGNRGSFLQASTEEAIYSAMTLSPAFSTEEAKADVYAQLAENLTETTPFELACDIIEAALNNTQSALGYV